MAHLRMVLPMSKTHNSHVLGEYTSHTQEYTPRTYRVYFETMTGTFLAVSQVQASNVPQAMELAQGDMANERLAISYRIAYVERL